MVGLPLDRLNEGFEEITYGGIRSGGKKEEREENLKLQWASVFVFRLT
jgi:hypothetical protein